MYETMAYECGIIGKSGREGIKNILFALGL